MIQPPQNTSLLLENNLTKKIGATLKMKKIWILEKKKKNKDKN